MVYLNRMVLDEMEWCKTGQIHVFVARASMITSFYNMVTFLIFLIPCCLMAHGSWVPFHEKVK